MSRTSAQRGDPSAWGRQGRERERERQREKGGLGRTRENQEQADGFIHISEDKT